MKTSKDVLIKQTESILRAAELPLFKYATTRAEDLKELAELIRARKSKRVGTRMTDKTIELACTLRKEGLSYGAITREIFHRIGESWDISTIEHAVKRNMNG